LIGAAVWAAMLACTLRARPIGVGEGALFLLVLATCASLMPVEALPRASWETTFALGSISAVFDNIPLTAPALRQGGYDLGLLAYAVGFGGSMVWFGSSAGVAVSSLFPEAKSAVAWGMRAAWWLPTPLCGGFFVMLGIMG
jgi:Na+/H+ antiporter NhaD/arsenite permease-like protein